MSTPRTPTDTLITLSWLVRLRWGAVSAQAVTIFVTSAVLGVLLPMGALSAALAVTVLTNVALWRRLQSPKHPGRDLLAGVLVLDTLLLTILLGLSGGPSNPFTVLYLLHVTLAVTMLGTGWGFAVAGLSAACFALLFRFHVRLPGVPDLVTPAWTLHLRGGFVAVAVTSLVIAYFVAQVAEELRDREAALSKAREQLARDEKLASLNMLAAGAAHELGTPLATIAVVAKELERALAGRSEATLTEDAKLIREQVERCRQILLQMSAKAGDTLGEAPGPVSFDELSARVKAMLSPEQSGRLELKGSGSLEVPKEALALVLASLVRNAFEATGGEGTVTLAARIDAVHATLEVIDRGHGMPADVLDRAFDPFFSTRPTGQGMGLGLFLARAFAERLGGSLELNSKPGEGTVARMVLPAVHSETKGIPAGSERRSA